MGGRNRHGPKSGGQLCPFLGGAGSPSNTYVALAEAYIRTKWYPNPLNRLATIRERHRQDRQPSDSIG